MDVKLGLITIGNGDWKEVIKNIWNSLDIADEGYLLIRAKNEYECKLNMDNTELPSYLTNYELHLHDNNTFRLTISMPFISEVIMKRIMIWYYLLGLIMK